MVIFHKYVSLPEGTLDRWINIIHNNDLMGISREYDGGTMGNSKANCYFFFNNHDQYN